MAIKRMQMYRKNLDTSETNLYPLTEAQYVSMENGQTVQEILSDRDSDKYTPVITNSSSTFKVGQGDNVDLSSSMKEGAYDSCVLKGKTMVNCIQEPSSKDVVLPYEFADGQYVTINDTKESGALGVELKGQTLKSLYTKTFTLDPKTQYSQLSVAHVKIQIELNKEYTIMIDVYKNNSNCALSFNTYGSSTTPTNGLHFNAGETGRKIAKVVFTSKQYSRWFWFETTIADTTATDSIQCEITVVDGNYVDVVHSHFEGLISCKMPILHTVGKNLFDMNRPYDAITDSQATVVQDTNQITVSSAESGTYVSANFILDKDFFAGKTVTASCLYESDIKDIGTVQISYQDGNGEHHYQWIRTPRTFTFPNSFIGDVMLCVSANNTGTPQSNTVTVKNIQLELGSVTTSYEPHKSSILSLPEEVVLRSLPNGVCDTFNARTGVYTQRIGEAVVNGSENWQLNNTEETTTQRFFCGMLANSAVDNNTKGTQQYLSDRLRTITWSQTCELGVTINGSGVFVYNNSIEYTVSSVKQWLSQNPVKLQYELATPVVTKINLSSTLKSWNTTTHIYSEIPENSLYPILSHSNPTYPIILKPSTKYSIVANSYSNSHTNSPINFNLGGATASTTVGNRVTTITTPSTLSNELLTMSGRGNRLNNVMVIEGDVVGDEPYFEGICDCKSPILSNVGKNFAHIRTDLNSSGGSVDSTQVVNSSNGIVATSLVQIKGGEEYILTYNGSGSQSRYFLFKDNPLNGAISYTGQYNFPTNGTLKISTQKGDKYLFVVWTRDTVNYPITNMQIEQKSSATTYEPYKSNTITFDQKDDKTIVLRSLPNGVCDTLNVETGEYVQRIGEVVLDGTKRFGKNMPESEYNKPCVRVSCTNALVNGSSTPQFNMKADKIAIGHYSYNMNYPVMAGLHEQALYIYIPRTIIGLTTNDNDAESIANAFNSWLTRNPITVQYPLATPIVSTIDVQGFPYAYTNGHVQLSSGSIEQSLTPTVEYSLSANKTGQINSNTKRVSAHQKQLDDFEAMMLTAMVQSAYDKAILQFDYEMQMMSLGGE